MAYKLAIFDMDGTILDTIRDLTNGVNHALGQMGMPLRSVEYLREVVGNGIVTTLKRCAPPDITDAELAELHSFFAPFYEIHRTDNTRPYDGVAQLLEKLKQNGVKTAVVSNKSDVSVKPLCDRYFKGLFDISLGTSEGMAKKPSPEMPESIIAHFGFDKKDVVYIGDSEVDVMTAKNTEIDGIFVDWGFRTREKLKMSGAEVIASDAESVFDLIMK